MSSSIIKISRELSDRKLARQLRKDALNSMVKTSQELDFLDQYKGETSPYTTRQHYLAERGGKVEKGLYGVGLPKHKDTDISVKEYSRSLSTRYSPDRVGVQARRVSDGVYQDPITKKIYDWNEGFKTEDGEVFGGSQVSLQTDIMYRK